MVITIFGILLLLLAIGLFAEGLFIPALVFGIAGLLGWVAHSWWPLVVGFIVGWAMRLIGMDPGWKNKSLNPQKLMISILIVSYFGLLIAGFNGGQTYFDKQMYYINEYLPQDIAQFIEYKVAKEMHFDPALKQVISAMRSRGDDLRPYAQMQYRSSWNYVSSLFGPLCFGFALAIIKLITGWANWVASPKKKP